MSTLYISEETPARSPRPPRISHSPLSSQRQHCIPNHSAQHFKSLRTALHNTQVARYSKALYISVEQQQRCQPEQR